MYLVSEILKNFPFWSHSSKSMFSDGVTDRTIDRNLFTKMIMFKFYCHHLTALVTICGQFTSASHQF